MEDVTFVVHREWLNSIKGLPLDQQDKIIADIVRYGVGVPLEYEEDGFIASLVNMLKGRITYSKEKYKEKVEMAKKAGRKKKLDDDLILRLALEGKKSQEIADILNCSKTAIDHSDGWKRRKTIAKVEAGKFNF